MISILGSEAFPRDTRVIAAMKDNPLVSLGFSRCDGQPCFLGIVPGKTLWQDATAVLSRQNFRKDTWSFTNIDYVGVGITVDRVPDKPDVVNSVSMNDLSQRYKVNLFHVLDLYSFPCSVGSDFKGSFWFAYPNMLVNAFSDDDRIPSRTSVIFVYLVDPQLPISNSGFSVCEKVEYSREYLLWFTEVF
jgi:hypothetical protein